MLSKHSLILLGPDDMNAVERHMGVPHKLLYDVDVLNALIPINIESHCHHCAADGPVLRGGFPTPCLVFASELFRLIIGRF